MASARGGFSGVASPYRSGDDARRRRERALAAEVAGIDARLATLVDRRAALDKKRDAILREARALSRRRLRLWRELVADGRRTQGLAREAIALLVSLVALTAACVFALWVAG
jgi:hypothetical protein